MFDRKTYKTMAKEQLKGKWGLPFCVILICSIVLAIFNVIPELTLPQAQYELFSLITLPIFYILVGTITIAQAYFFVEFVKDKNNTVLNTFFEGFSLWVKGTLGLLWMMLWLVLWSFLFIIPGIVKIFSYSQMVFVLAENPHVGVRKAMRISKEMTKGYKGDLFFLSVSFIGWYLLTSIPFILILFFTPIVLGEINLLFYGGLYGSILLGTLLAPYYYTTHIYAYFYLKKAALDRKALSPGDFEKKSHGKTIEQ